MKTLTRWLRDVFPAMALLMAGAPLPVWAAAVQAEHVEAELISEHRTLQTGSGQNWLALRLRPEAGWHVYWRNPGDSGLPTRLQWTLPEGVTAGDIEWPYPHAQSLGDLTNYGYDAETLHLVPLTVAPGLADTTVTVQALAKWLVCADVCIPGEAQLQLTLPVLAAEAAPDPRWSDAFLQARSHLPRRVGSLQARFEIASGEFRLAVQGLPEAAATARFFPYDGELIQHSAPARLMLEAQGLGLRLATTLSPYFVEAPAEVAGVLLVTTGPAGEVGKRQAQAYEVRAMPGSVATVAGLAQPQPRKPAEAAPAAVVESAGWGSALLFALLGGLILNLMPCVFPVLSFKALSVMQTAVHSATENRRQALAYTAGVLASFAVVAGVLMALRAGGAALGWGFQLQSPLFIVLLAWLLFALGLSMSGFIEFGAGLMGAGQGLAARPGLSGSFFTGVLATVVASPCTAPFMGTALGYALTQPPLQALSVFLALGLGLALPFLLLGFVPALARALPRPGAWMDTFKQLMAFPLYLTVVWLLWVLARQVGANGTALALFGLVFLSLALWVQRKPTPGLALRTLQLLALAAMAGVLTLPGLRPQEAGGQAALAAGWEPYSDARFEALRAEGRTVFVDFTADWCITCKVNERVAIHTDAVEAAMARENVARLLGDWTRSDPAITAVLQRHGRSGVPLYLVSRKGAEPIVLPQVLTESLVIESIAGS